MNRLPEDDQLRLAAVSPPPGRQIHAGYGPGGPVAWAPPSEAVRSITGYTQDTARNEVTESNTSRQSGHHAEPQGRHAPENRDSSTRFP